MKPIFVAVTIERTPEEIWDYVVDIASHVEWMHDAAEITFTSDQTEGLGTTFDCLTVFGPLRTVDEMTITEWEPTRTMGVRHSGVVTGEGRFELHPVGARHTVFAWRERLDLPWRLGGPVGAVAAKPIMTAVWNRNLQNLKRLCEARP